MRVTICPPQCCQDDFFQKTSCILKRCKSPKCFVFIENITNNEDGVFDSEISRSKCLRVKFSNKGWNYQKWHRLFTAGTTHVLLAPPIGVTSGVVCSLAAFPHVIARGPGSEQTTRQTAKMMIGPFRINQSVVIITVLVLLGTAFLLTLVPHAGKSANLKIL